MRRASNSRASSDELGVNFTEGGPAASRETSAMPLSFGADDIESVTWTIERVVSRALQQHSPLRNLVYLSPNPSAKRQLCVLVLWKTLASEEDEGGKY